MKLHERFSKVKKASLEIDEAIWNLTEKHDLTYGEIIKILAEKQAVFATYLIRTERHPNEPDKKGDEA